MRPAENEKHTGLWLLLGLATTLLVLSGLTQVGVGWDEPEQIHAGFSYTYWFTDGADRLSEATIRRFWTWDPAHPPLGKLLMGVMVRLAGGVLGMLSAARIASAGCLGATVALVGAWCERELGTRAALAAAVSRVFFPRVFGAAHFASLDTPMMLTWLLAVVTFERALRRAPENAGLGPAWSPAALLAGVAFGLALLTKLNAVFLPLVLWPWALARYGRRARGPILAALIIGPVLFFVGWPSLYHDTVTRTLAYLLEKVGRPVLPVYYLGRAYVDEYAPWHYPLVMVAVTVPVGLLAAGVAGIVSVGRRRRRAVVAELSLVNLVGILLVAAVPWAPKYDGVRLFLPAFPFLAVLVGVGLERIWRWLSVQPDRWRQRGQALAVIVLLAQGFGLIRAWPFHLTYYTMVVGGRRGAQQLGFETMYWGEAFDREAWRALEEVIADDRAEGPSVRVSFIGVAKEAPEFLQEHGYLTRDFIPVGPGTPEAEYLVVTRSEGWLAREGRLHLLDAKVIEEAVFVRKHLGVPLCWILSQEARQRPTTIKAVRQGTWRNRLRR